MRYMAAPWMGLLENGVWLKNARHANDCAAVLEAEIRKFPKLEVLMPREANAVFVRMPEALSRGLNMKGWHFYPFIGADGIRLMCSWDTREEDIREFVGDIREILRQKM
jgi:threonine aldolase